jgi:hypothetical protein
MAKGLPSFMPRCPTADSQEGEAPGLRRSCALSMVDPPIGISLYGERERGSLIDTLRPMPYTPNLVTQVSVISPSFMQGALRVEFWNAACEFSVDHIIRIIAESREQLCSEFGVIGIGIFGSVARGEQGAGSDIDILYV